MLGVELTLFIIVGAIAILAAVMMLVSENAVHSALFLIVNFACVAFFYLMLNAPFLAMVQITVYAGAIMVLFLFVIMLLGAEKLTPESSPQFPWLTPVAIGLTTVFLLVASIAIIRSDLDESEPKPQDPVLRVVHAVGGADAVDIYINGELWAEDLAFREASNYAELTSGEHHAVIVPHGADVATTEPILASPVFLDDNAVVTLVVMPDAVNGGIRVLPVTGSLEAVEEDKTVELTVVHAFPCEGGDCAVDLADITIPSDDPFVIINNLNYGEISAIKTLNAGEYVLGAFPAGEIATKLETATDDNTPDFDPLAEVERTDFEANTSLLWIVTADPRGGQIRPETIFLATDNTDAFGSGQSIGRRLFTTYMLPFQAIGLLLLVAMIGVIVLTNALDGSRPTARPKRVRRMAAVPGNPTLAEYQKFLDDSSSGD